MNNMEIRLNLFNFSSILYWDGYSFGLKSYTFPRDDGYEEFKNAALKAVKQFNDQAFEVEATSWEQNSKLFERFQYEP